MARKAMTVSLADIPTLQDAYAREEIQRDEEFKPLFEPKKALLDKVSLYQGDITRLEVDAIVNAANRSLLGGGGVDGAIHSAAGRGLLEECRTLNGCETGGAKITKGYNLPANHVIHTVGPIYNESRADVMAEQLASAYRQSLELAVENGLKHAAFPSISTGIYGYPIDDATHIALKTVREYLDAPDGNKLDRVIFVVWSDRDKGVYQELIPLYFPLPTAEDTADAPAA